MIIEAIEMHVKLPMKSDHSQGILLHGIINISSNHCVSDCMPRGMDNEHEFTVY